MSKHYTDRRVIPVFVALAAIGSCAGVHLSAAEEPMPAKPNTIGAHGAAEVNSNDLQGLIDRAIQAGDKRVVVPPGRYRVKPRNGQHLLLENLKDLEVIADGVELICTETIRALTIANCRNVTVRGLVIDYDPLPFTQGKIVKLCDDQKRYEVELFEGYPTSEVADTFKYNVFRSDTRTLRRENPGVTKIEVLDPRHLRVTNVGGNLNGVVLGDLIVTGVNYRPWDDIIKDVDRYSLQHDAVVCDSNANVRLDKIVVYASHWFGFFERNCDGTVYNECRVDRRPEATDIVKRGSPRVRSTNADAFHGTRALKGPSYIGCHGKFMGDDAVNIHGDFHMVTECHGDMLRVLARDDLNIAVGDPVQLFTYDGHNLPTATVTKVEPDGKINAGEKAFLGKQNLREIYKSRWNADAWKVTLDRKVEMACGSVIISMRHMGNGFLIKDCVFGGNATRSIVLRAGEGKIVGNRLEDNGMPAIWISSEWYWLEGGIPFGVEVRDNTIVNCATHAIVVGGPNPQSGEQREVAGLYQDIVIADNTMIDTPLPSIVVNATKGARIENNCHRRRDGLKSGPQPSKASILETNDCIDVIEINNVLK